VARAVITSDPERRPAFEPLYDLHPRTGETLEVFYVDRALARSFGAGAIGFYWWTCQPGGLPSEPHGPFRQRLSCLSRCIGQPGARIW
jgi:hypothetical protein